MTTLYKFLEPLDYTPDFGVFSKDQSHCLIAAKDKGIIVNLKTDTETDLDDEESI